jgi:hypothetical protein
MGAAEAGIKVPDNGSGLFWILGGTSSRFAEASERLASDQSFADL